MDGNMSYEDQKSSSILSTYVSTVSAANSQIKNMVEGALQSDSRPKANWTERAAKGSSKRKLQSYFAREFLKDIGADKCEPIAERVYHVFA